MRLREEQLRDKGPVTLSDFELISLLVGEVEAQKIMEMDLRNIHELFLEEMEEILPSEAAAKLKAAAEMGRRIASTSRRDNPVIMTPEDAINILLEDMRYLQKEHFKALLLDVRNKVIAIETISIGTLDTGLVHPREALGPALRKSAAYVIFAHNHPSGNPSPSNADIEMTARLMVAGEVLGIEVMDHIVIGDGDYFSFREEKELFQ